MHDQPKTTATWHTILKAIRWPKHLKQWIEEEAKKPAPNRWGFLSRQTFTSIVVKALEDYRDKIEADRKKAPTPPPKKTKSTAPGQRNTVQKTLPTKRTRKK